MGIGLSKTTEEDMASAKAIVDAAIAENAVMVFSKSYCPFCMKAKRALESVLPKEKICVMELEMRSDCAAIQDYLLEITGARSVPRVFIAGECIGGGDETDAMVRSGELKRLLEAKNIL